MIDRYAVVIPTNGKAVTLHCDKGNTMKLETMQELVEGNIETVLTMLAKNWGDADDVILIVNEEGKLRGLPENEFATDVANIFLGEWIVGNAILMQVKGEDFIGFTEEDANHIINEWF